MALCLVAVVTVPLVMLVVVVVVALVLTARVVVAVAALPVVALAAVAAVLVAVVVVLFLVPVAVVLAVVLGPAGGGSVAVVQLLLQRADLSLKQLPQRVGVSERRVPLLLREEGDTEEGS